MNQKRGFMTKLVCQEMSSSRLPKIHLEDLEDKVLEGFQGLRVSRINSEGLKEGNKIHLEIFLKSLRNSSVDKDQVVKGVDKEGHNLNKKEKILFYQLRLISWML